MAGCWCAPIYAAKLDARNPLAEVTAQRRLTLVIIFFLVRSI
jgi:hypothetical protein